MPWGILHLNVNCDKTGCATALLSTAPHCQCYHFIYDVSFSLMELLEPYENGIKTLRILDPGLRDPGRTFGILRNLGDVKNRNESDVKEGYKL